MNHRSILHEDVSNALERAQSKNLTWDERLLAIQDLETLVLTLPSRSIVELLTKIGPISKGQWAAIGVSGESPTEIADQLKNRIKRLSYWYRPDISPEWRTHLSRKPRKITLARFLLEPDSVVERVLAAFRRSRGKSVPSKSGDDSLPEFLSPAERELFDVSATIIFWTPNCDTTSTVDHSTSFGSLVDFPADSAAAFCHLPGSDLEIEIKRIGIKGPRPIDIRCTENDSLAHFSRRIWGGASFKALHYEERAAKAFSLLYTNIYNERAPLPRTLAINQVETIPCQSGEQCLYEYLNDATLGIGLASFREQLYCATAAFSREAGCSDSFPQEKLDEIFIKSVAPAQSLQVNTSVWRLETIGPLLTYDLAKISMPEALDVLEEVLGLVNYPIGSPKSAPELVDALFNNPPNRAKADSTFLDLTRQLGRVWGTAFSLGMGSHGESFASRNIGLRARFKDGHWSTGLIFMDHDRLTIPGPERPSLLSLGSSQSKDNFTIFGGTYGEHNETGVLSRLAEVYRIGDEGYSDGLKSFFEAFWGAWNAVNSYILDPESNADECLPENWLRWLKGHHRSLEIFFQDESAKAPTPDYSWLRHYTKTVRFSSQTPASTLKTGFLN